MDEYVETECVQQGVIMRTTHLAQEIQYAVFVRGRLAWARHVKFGKDKAHRAGGTAFVQAARDQEFEARKLNDVLKEGGQQ